MKISACDQPVHSFPSSMPMENDPASRRIIQDVSTLQSLDERNECGSCSDCFQNFFSSIFEGIKSFFLGIYHLFVREDDTDKDIPPNTAFDALKEKLGQFTEHSSFPRVFIIGMRFTNEQEWSSDHFEVAEIHSHEEFLQFKQKIEEEGELLQTSNDGKELGESDSEWGVGCKFKVDCMDIRKEPGSSHYKIAEFFARCPPAESGDDSGESTSTVDDSDLADWLDLSEQGWRSSYDRIAVDQSALNLIAKIRAL